MKVVFDSNVLIAAFITQGHCAEIYQYACVNEHIVVSQYILEEVTRHLMKKFHFTPSDVSAVIVFIKDHASYVATVPKLDKPVCRDRNDDAIIALAVHHQAQAIFTGDKDLLTLGHYHHIPILSPRVFWSFTQT